MKFHGLLSGAALPVLAFAMIAPAMAQSTGTDAVEETIIVTGSAKAKGGLIRNETIPKTRSTITSDYIEKQQAGQSINQTLNLLPGVNFTNNDPYGSSGGNIRLRSFDGPRISQTFDGIPLNDTGNYSIYSNQQVDGEIIARATVNLGTTDVDSPTASATGGTINISTRRPDDEFAVRLTESLGTNNFARVFIGVDTGEIGPWGTTAFLTGSYQKYDKFKGRGELEKQQYNAKIYQPLGGDDFISIAAHWNINRNNSYRNASKATLLGFTDASGTFVPGNYDYDFNDTCVRPAPGFDTVQNESVGDAAGCSNYYDVRINPSNTGNLRIQSSFGITDKIRLTIDPNFQYVLANGGSGNATFRETDAKLIGNSSAAGVDLNGDGDVLDTVRLNSTSNTKTFRYGVTASLIYDLDENNTLRAAYTVDYGLHRQTGEVGFLKADGSQVDPFAGMKGPKVVSADGVALRSRDRKSIAKLNQFAVSYNGSFMDDTLKVALGVRLPYFERELNQYCYTAANSSNVNCTTQVPTTLANGNVVFGSPTSTQYITPFSGVIRKYDEVLPNVGVSYEFAENNIVFASYAKGLSAPRTDNLYTARVVDGVVTLLDSESETTDSYDIGYRFQGDQITLSASLWMTMYDNRIVNAFDEELGFSIFRNLGKVDLQGFDIEAAYQPVEGLTLYASASYIDSEVKDNTPTGATTFLPTAGKELVETPDWTVSGRIEYDIANFTFGAQAKYVGDRFATDINDEIAEAYTVVDLDVRYDFAEMGYDGTYAQLNVTNLFDEEYLGSISSTPTAAAVPFYNVGAPQTVQFTMGFKF